ncbi:hypothetical protein GCM10008170_24350 [Methylopila capsulata]|uniref:Uncharacterized protein n=1 Tax=Methylopila capsulata TaxID=61654 RepID=A0A9W6ITS4_9HYPH|nr:hypothetical protein GCM10008170_24350 [Methylopila capsulata]
MCSACHAYKLVAARAMSRERWDKTMTLMPDKHGMPEARGRGPQGNPRLSGATHPPKKAKGTGVLEIPFAPR